MLTIVDQSPHVGGALAPDATIAFTLVDPATPASVTISLNDQNIYLNEMALAGYAVMRTSVSQGVRYVITKLAGWAYDEVVRVGIFAQMEQWWYRWFLMTAPLTLEPYGDGEPVSADTASWSVKGIEDSSCFIGPVNAFEASLLLPFLTRNLQQTEVLRAFLLDYAIRYPQANRAVRWLRLRAHASDLAPVLRDLVPTPTVPEQQVRLCHQRTDLEIDQGLRGKVDILTQVIDELQALGLPASHVRLCTSYDRNDPNLRVPLACVLVCLAKALDVQAVT